jgi:DNA-binding XRE family transcriptional regulator
MFGIGVIMKNHQIKVEGAFPVKLKRLRQEKGWSQAQVAKQIGTMR